MLWGWYGSSGKQCPGIYRRSLVGGCRPQAPVRTGAVAPVLLSRLRRLLLPAGRGKNVISPLLANVIYSLQQSNKHKLFTIKKWYQMALSNEDLLAISQLLDVKIKSSLQSELQPLKDELRDMKQRITSIALHIENTTDKNIQLLAENYVKSF